MKDLSFVIRSGLALGLLWAIVFCLWYFTARNEGQVEETTQNRLQRIEKKVDILIESGNFRLQIN